VSKVGLENLILAKKEKERYIETIAMKSLTIENWSPTRSVMNRGYIMPFMRWVDPCT
jgi:hypothetical protein